MAKGYQPVMEFARILSKSSQVLSTSAVAPHRGASGSSRRGTSRANPFSSRTWLVQGARQEALQGQQEHVLDFRAEPEPRLRGLPAQEHRGEPGPALGHPVREAAQLPQVARRPRAPPPAPAGRWRAGPGRRAPPCRRGRPAPRRAGARWRRAAPGPPGGRPSGAAPEQHRHRGPAGRVRHPLGQQVRVLPALAECAGWPPPAPRARARRGAPAGSQAASVDVAKVGSPHPFHREHALELADGGS